MTVGDEITDDMVHHLAHGTHTVSDFLLGEVSGRHPFLAFDKSQLVE